MNKLQTIVLKNGLTLYLYPDKKRHSTLFYFITRFGGLTKDFRYQGKEYHLPDGVAHILEHYVAECNREGNFLEILGDKQMITNAYTDFRSTGYYFNTVEDVSFGIDTLLKGITSVSFQKESLEKIKKPIYQEIRGKSDSKFYHSGIRSLENLFHHLSFRSVGGSLEEVGSITCEDLQLCYDAFYQPSNQMIVIAGNFQEEEVIKQITSFYQKIPSHEPVEILPVKEDITVHKKEDVLVYKTPMDYTEISFKVDVSHLSPVESLDLSFYLGCFYNQFFGPISPLYRECVEEGILSAGIQAGEIRIDPFLIISVGAYTHDSKAFIKKVLKVMKDLPYFQEEAFELDKKSTIIRMIMRDESIHHMISPFIENLIDYQYPYLDEVNDVKKMNYQDFVKSIQAIDFSHYSILTIKEKES